MVAVSGIGSRPTLISVFSSPPELLAEPDPPHAETIDIASMAMAVAQVQRRSFMELLDGGSRWTLGRGARGGGQATTTGAGSHRLRPGQSIGPPHRYVWEASANYVTYSDDPAIVTLRARSACQCGR